jgi:hypothetical protein
VTVPPLKLGIQATDETRAAFESVQQSMRQTERTASQMGATVSGSGRMMRGTFQSAGYQVQDFAVQVQGGQSALLAFSQQSSQFLGAFGPGGAIAGAIITIGALGYKIWEAASAAKGATDAVTRLEDAIAKLQDEAKKQDPAQPGIIAVERMRDLRDDLLEQRRALESTQSAFAGGVSAEFGGVVEGQSAREVTAIQAQIKALNDLISTYDKLILNEDKRAQEAAIKKKDAEDIEEKTKREAEAVRAAARAAEEATRQELAYSAAIRQTILSLDPVAAAAEKYAGQQVMLRDALEAGSIDQERYNALLARAAENYQNATTAIDRHSQSLDEQARRIKAQIDPAVAYAEELARLNELLDTGRLTHDEYARAAEQAWERVNRTSADTKDIARELGLTFESAFEDAIVKGQSFRNVLGGIAQDMARLVLRQTVTTPLAGFGSSAIKFLFGGGAPTVGAALGPTDLGLPGFADGGPVAGGRPIIVGEEGPELFVPRGHGQIIPNGQSAGGTVVNQTINISVGVAQTVRAEIAALMPAIKRQTVDAVADARMRGGTFASAMGT